jgi:hypothetical protein
MVSLLISVIATLILFQRYERAPHTVTDFEQVHFGAKMLVRGIDPYPLVGPGKQFDSEYVMLYPATSFVIIMPLAYLSAHAAAMIFVFVSAFLLAYGATRTSWHLLPMFGSAAFVDCALGGQWSPLLVAALFTPWLGFFACAKPQLGFAVVAGRPSGEMIRAAALGCGLLFLTSWALLPHWPFEWLAAARTADHMRAPITQPLGWLIALVLLRWRYSESWLVFVAACLPQTLMWYSFLVLLATARTYREACYTSLISSIGYFVVHLVAETQPQREPTGMILWGIVVLTCYLPVVIMLLRRPAVPAGPDHISSNYPVRDRELKR